MEATPGRLYVGVYLAVVGALAALTVGLSYGLFAAGFAAGFESFLADPADTVQENPLGLLGLAGVFVSLFLLFVAVVVGGARYADIDGGNRPE